MSVNNYYQYFQGETILSLYKITLLSLYLCKNERALLNININYILHPKKAKFVSAIAAQKGIKKVTGKCMSF